MTSIRSRPVMATLLISLVACATNIIAISQSDAQIHNESEIRNQIIDGLRNAQGVQVVVVEVFRESGAFPDNNDVAGLPPPEELVSEYVDYVEINDGGAIAIFFGRNADETIKEKMIVLAPFITEGQVKFRCFSPDISKSYLPSACR